MRSSRFMLVPCVVGVLASACAAPEEAANGDEQDVTEHELATPFENAKYAFELRASKVAVPAGKCTASFSLKAPGAFAKADPSDVFDLPLEAASAALSGKLELPRYVREIKATVKVFCSDAARASADVVFAGLADPQLGKSATVTGKVEKIESTSGILDAATPITLTLRTEAIEPGPQIAASNCKEFAQQKPAEVAKYFVRVRTYVGTDDPFTGPYGDDWEAKLDIGGGKLKHTFHPKLHKPGIAVVAFCQPKSAGEDLHVKISVKENDLVVDDKYKAVDQDFKRGAAQRFFQESADNIGESRPIETQVEVQ